MIAALACAPPGRTGLAGTAIDEWTRSFELGATGELDINNPAGAIEIEAVDGTTVDVRAERIVRAITDAAAADVLPRIVIAEDVLPGKVGLRTQPLGGIVIGVEIEVRYHVRAPRAASVRARTRGGALTVRGFQGRVVLNGANGSLTAEGLRGGVEARWANGPAAIALEAVGEGFVDVRVTNGSLTVALPRSANANLSASATNGRVEVKGLDVEPLGEQTPRRVRVRLNEGGAPIELSTVNGSVAVGPINGDAGRQGN